MDHRDPADTRMAAWRVVCHRYHGKLTGQPPRFHRDSGTQTLKGGIHQTICGIPKLVWENVLFAISSRSGEVKSMGYCTNGSISPDPSRHLGSRKSSKVGFDGGFLRARPMLFITYLRTIRRRSLSFASSGLVSVINLKEEAGSG